MNSLEGSTMRVIGYIRVSTDEQANSGLSLDAQRAKLEAYASLYDLELVEVIEDAGLVQAIKEGEDTEYASRDEVFAILDDNNRCFLARKALDCVCPSDLGRQINHLDFDTSDGGHDCCSLSVYRNQSRTNFV